MLLAKSWSAATSLWGRFERQSIYRGAHMAPQSNSKLQPLSPVAPDRRIRQHDGRSPSGRKVP
jgi:hypothetical protein